MKRRGDVSTPDAVFAKLKHEATVSASGCWLLASKRYPSVLVLGVRIQAHRFAWEYFYGKKMPEGCDACHTCDTKNCVNPEHIWPGSRTDNMRDAAAKGRTGSANRKLSVDDVRHIRAALASGIPVTKLAVKFGVHHATISEIGSGRKRKRDGGKIAQRKISVGSLVRSAKLSEAIVSKMRAEHAAGATVTSLARKDGVSVGTASPMLHGKTWKHVGPAIAEAEKDAGVE